MNTELHIIISMTVYKLSSLAVGVFFAYMGYRLFMAGIWGESGDIEAKFSNSKLVIKRAAPGTFFVVFGTIIVCSVVFTKLTYELRPNNTDESLNTKFEEHEKTKLPEELPF